MSHTAVNRALRTGLRAVLIALMVGLITVMSTQIVMRYGLNSSLLWSEELCRYMLIWAAFLAMIFAYERGEIAALSILANALPRKGALGLAIFGGVLSALMCFMLAWYGYRFASLAGGQPIPAISFIYGDIFGADAPEAPKVFWVYAALPFGMALLGLRIVFDIWLYLKAWTSGRTLADIVSPERGLSQ